MQTGEWRHLPIVVRVRQGRIAAALAGLLLASLAARAQPMVEATTPAGGPPITPLPVAVGLDADKVGLGERLFNDPRLSGGNEVACATCHRLDRGGDDDQAQSIGADGKPLDFNAPTVFNAALSFRFNWRGNFRTLEEQAEAVLLDRRLMDATWPDLLAKLQGDPGYRDAFAAAYGDGPTRASVLDALATFERSLVTPNAPFDRFLRGEPEALGADARRGYELFRTYGCVACHQGVNVGGNLFQRFGVFERPRFPGADPSPTDLGRFTITDANADRRVFRVPSLRNVGVTAPYFHDGRAADLEQAVAAMARSQLGRTLTSQEVSQIAAFLDTLTGEYRGRRLGSGAGAAP